MRVETVTCDACERDLTTRTNSVDYRLVVASEGKPGHGSGFYTDMMIYPPIERTHHFCGLSCLDLWRDRERFKAKLWKEHNDAWKRAHGRDLGGGMWSYPSQPREDRAALEAEFSKAALDAFPVPQAKRPSTASVVQSELGRDHLEDGVAKPAADPE